MEFSLGLIGWGMAGTGRPLSNFRQSGDDVDIDIEYRLTTVDDAKSVRQQILAYLDAGEPVLPLTWSGDPSFNGYYRLTKTSTVTDHGVYLSRRVVAQFSLTRIQSYSSPIVESIFSGARRSFVAADPGVTPWIVAPSSWATDSAVLGYLIFDTMHLVSPTLGLRCTNVSTYNTILQSRVPPANFYDGAVLLRSGPNLAVQTGRNIVTDPTHWSIDNGLVRIVNSQNAASHFSMFNRNKAGTAWSTREKQLTAGVWTGSSIDPWGSGTSTIVLPSDVTVLRNTPEQVTISLYYRYDQNQAPSLAAAGGMSLQISLRRGSRIANISITSSTPDRYALAYANWIGAGDLFKANGSSMNNGLTEHSLDSDNQAAQLYAGSSGLTLLTSGTIYSATSTALIEVGVGCEVDRQAALEVGPALLAQYLAAQTEAIRIAGQ